MAYFDVEVCLPSRLWEERRYALLPSTGRSLIKNIHNIRIGKTIRNRRILSYTVEVIDDTEYDLKYKTGDNIRTCLRRTTARDCDYTPLYVRLDIKSSSLIKLDITEVRIYGDNNIIQMGEHNIMNVRPIINYDDLL
jgi:hypothetical protein